MKILVVDDEPMVLGLAETILKHAGHEVITAPSAEQALKICEESPWLDLVISDVMMPGMSGRELADCISRMPKPIRIILMSGYTGEGEHVLRLIREGRLDNYRFLQKPFSVQQLLSAIVSLD